MIRSRYIKRLPVISRSASFTPTSISGLAMWLDGADASSITLDGSNNVSQWSDKSGNGRNVLQGSATKRPSYTSGVQVNGITVPNFDGLDDALLTSGASSLSQPETVFAAFNLRSFSANAAIYDGSSTRQYVTFPTPTSIQAVGSGSISVTISSVVGTTSQVCMTFNGASSVLRLNRVQIGAGTVNGGVGPEIVIGNNPFSNSGFKGAIAEFLVYSRALTTTERDQVEAYLSARWGTP